MRQLRIGVAVACAACGLAAVRPAQASTVPRWVRAADHRTLDRAFGGARPTETHYISYPKQIAVIFEFSRVVICGAMPACRGAV